jgi:hypothetical protein
MYRYKLKAPGLSGTSLGGVRVVCELERLTLGRGTPRIIVSDYGTELTSGAVGTSQFSCSRRCWLESSVQVRW